MGFRDIFNTLKGMAPPSPTQKKRLINAMMMPTQPKPKPLIKKLRNQTSVTQNQLDQLN